jgi:hypothetical protein
MKDLQVFKSLLLRTVLIAMLSLLWSAQAPAFYTVHRVSNVFIDMIFQAGPGRTHSEKIKARHILEELRGTKPSRQEVLAAVMDCNDQYAIYLVVWDRRAKEIVAGTDMIALTIVDYVVESHRKNDFRTALIDADALFGSGYLTAVTSFRQINDRLIPPGAGPADETFCLSQVRGVSAAGFIEGDSFGIVTGGRLSIGKPMATLSEFIPAPP